MTLVLPKAETPSEAVEYFWHASSFGSEEIAANYASTPPESFLKWCLPSDEINSGAYYAVPKPEVLSGPGVDPTDKSADKIQILTQKQFDYTLAEFYKNLRSSKRPFSGYEIETVSTFEHEAVVVVRDRNDQADYLKEHFYLVRSGNEWDVIAHRRIQNLELLTNRLYGTSQSCR